jgi:glycosyltransferase involved in cell wall biosynthesis
MRVAVNAEQLLQPSPGGIGRYTARLVTLLGAGPGPDEVGTFVARHRSTDIARAWERYGLSDAPGVALPAVLGLPRPLLYDAWHLLGYPPLTVQSRALAGTQIIHAPSLAVPPPGRLPLVVSVHDAAPVLFPEAFSARGRWFHRLGLHAAARRADVVITGTRAAADEIAELTPIRGEKIRVVPYGVDQQPVGPDSVAAVRVRYGLADRPFVLWVGSLEPRKGVGTLVAAMAELQGSAGTAEIDLVLAGFDGWMHRGLIDPGHRATLGDRLRHLGRVPDGDLAALYGAAEVFAFPSRHEGFGLPVLEAMAQRTAVVCSDIAPLREVAGDAAAFVAPGDIDGWAHAIGQLLGDESGRRSLADAGRRRSEEFTWQKMVDATRAVYREVMGADR